MTLRGAAPPPPLLTCPQRVGAAAADVLARGLEQEAVLRQVTIFGLGLSEALAATVLDARALAARA